MKLKIEEHGEERFYFESGLTFSDVKEFMNNDADCGWKFLSQLDKILLILNTNINELLEISYKTVLSTQESEQEEYTQAAFIDDITSNPNSHKSCRKIDISGVYGDDEREAAYNIDNPYYSAEEREKKRNSDDTI